MTHFLDSLAPPRLAAVLLTLAGAFAVPGVALATSFRAYLASDGNDSNPCTLAAPCRLLPAALLAVSDGGEIWILDSGNFNTATVTVAKSVTILAIPGAEGSIVANGGDAISITAAAAKVALRNLSVRTFSGSGSGIVFGGTALTVDGCEIQGLFDGIVATSSNATVSIRDTIIRDNNRDGLRLTGVSQISLAGVQLLHNGFGPSGGSGLTAQTGARITIVDSLASGNFDSGLLVRSTIGGVTQLFVERTVVRGNGIGLSAAAASGIGSTVQIFAARNTIADNATGIAISSENGTTASAMVDANTITLNGTGISIAGAGTSTGASRLNNTFTFNGTDVAGGTLAPVSAQ
jgi:hypothetical protein